MDTSLPSVDYCNTIILSRRYVVGVVFGCEHMLLLVAVWLRYAIHPVTKPVRLAIARRNYLAQHRAGDTEQAETERETDKSKVD